MNPAIRRGVAFALPTALALTILAIIGTAMRVGTGPVNAGTPPRPLPSFEGEPFTATLADTSGIPRSTVNVPVSTGEWTTVLSETFEAGLNPLVWTSVDNDGLANGEYRWGTESFTNTTPGGTISVWAVGDGQDGGHLNPAADGYPTNVDSWLIAGPYDFTDVVEAELSFDYWFEAGLGDTFGVSVSSDGTTYSGLQTDDGGPGSWFGRSYNLTGYAGESTVYVAFTFTSDESANADALRGAFLDDVQLTVRELDAAYLPVMVKMPLPTATPSPTATPIPQDYYDGFSNANSGWQMVRADSDDWSIVYRAEGDLQLITEPENSYFIASPLFQGPAAPYEIETEAIIKDPQDEHAFGIIFAADWDGTTPCPGSGDANCFNHYYWLRVQWDYNNNNPRLEFTLRRIDGHDANNYPLGVTLIQWTAVSVNPGDYNRWNVVYEADGDIKVFVNGTQVGTARDTTYLGEQYFGLMQYAKANGTGRTRFDYFEVDAQ